MKESSKKSIVPGTILKISDVQLRNVIKNEIIKDIYSNESEQPPFDRFLNAIVLHAKRISMVNHLFWQNENRENTDSNDDTGNNENSAIVGELECEDDCEGGADYIHLGDTQEVAL